MTQLIPILKIVTGGVVVAFLFSEFAAPLVIKFGKAVQEHIGPPFDSLINRIFGHPQSLESTTREKHPTNP